MPYLGPCQYFSDLIQWQVLHSTYSFAVCFGQLGRPQLGYLHGTNGDTVLGQLMQTFAVTEVTVLQW